MTTELKDLAKNLSTGAHVTATGVDTRGRKVTRTGHLLADPIVVHARRNGFPTRALRLCIGAPGTDPTDRSTWTTLFTDSGTAEHTPEPEPTTWSNTELRYVPGVRASNHTTRIRYGGKGGARSTGPTQDTPVNVYYTDDGIYALWDPETDTTHGLARLTTKIWWAPAPRPHTDSPNAPTPA
ncbi:hypothetical protein [Streptomyces californicus]|uniref:hypothetical protein n=1 Tax=Streptomyces californicus TaxID=67351 RepID=UPI00296F883D|nr:hypothetical protein [Streptomyces californicus]MDW4912568.1 hypothetical protein [Streptomyces californicus]